MDLAFWNLKMIPFPQKTHASLTRIHSFSNQMFGWGEAFSASIFPWSPGRARGNEWSWNVMKSVWIANICWQGKFWWFGYKQLTNIYTLSTPPHLQGVNSHVIWLLPKRSHDCTSVQLHFVWQKSPGGDFFSKFAFAGVLIDEVRTSKEVGLIKQAQPNCKGGEV